MADSDSLKVMCLFEAGAKLGCGAETVGLSAHLYHRFFRAQPELSHYELYTFAAACLKLAHSFYEIPLNISDLALVVISVVHGPHQNVTSETLNKLEQSIGVAYRIVAINLNFNIDYTDTRMITPGALMKSDRENINTDGLIVLNEQLQKEQEDEGEEEEQDDDDAYLLAKNCRTVISSHRYLAHYLKTLHLLVDMDDQELFSKISNVAWTILSDFCWSPCFTQHYTNHLACACLMMAIEVFRPQLYRSTRKTNNLWQLLNKKWNLIFCEDLTNARLEIIIDVIIRQYGEYERVFEHEFSLHVIDPK